MKRGHFIFESILIGFTILAGITAPNADDAYIGLGIVMIPLGMLQVFHAAWISGRERTNKFLKKLLSIYWIAVIFDLLIVFSGMNFIHTDWILFLFFPLLPLCLAVFLWVITWIGWRRGIKSYPENTEA